MKHWRTNNDWVGVCVCVCAVRQAVQVSSLPWLLSPDTLFMYVWPAQRIVKMFSWCACRSKDVFANWHSAQHIRRHGYLKFMSHVSLLSSYRLEAHGHRGIPFNDNDASKIRFVGCWLPTVHVHRICRAPRLCAYSLIFPQCCMPTDYWIINKVWLGGNGN